MPSWNAKDRRMYEHIKESSEDRGVAQPRAEEIAARTVNKHRREEGRTPNKHTMGTGKPGEPLENKTKDELENIAAERDIRGRGSMNKKQLVKAIERNKQS